MTASNHDWTPTDSWAIKVDPVRDVIREMVSAGHIPTIHTIDNAAFSRKMLDAIKETLSQQSQWTEITLEDGRHVMLFVHKDEVRQSLSK